jgi:hypothetical protein
VLDTGMGNSSAPLPTSASFASINSDGLGSNNSNNDLHDMGMVESPSQTSLSHHWKVSHIVRPADLLFSCEEFDIFNLIFLLLKHTILYGIFFDNKFVNFQPNTSFLRKIPKDSHVANIMVGEVEDLPSRVMGFMRLKEPRLLQNDLSEVNIPTRFVFFCLGRRGEEDELVEFGRCMGTMMVDEVCLQNVDKTTFFLADFQR